MPLYKWDDLEETLMTPSRTRAKGKSIIGKRLVLQRVLLGEDRGDGKIGAVPHSHPEEQVFIPLKGILKLRMVDENKWYTLGVGDIFVVPPYVEHEEVCDEEFLWLNIKNRIPGHSWYDTNWIPGAEEDWARAEQILEEMDQKYEEKTPWSKDD